MHKPWLYHITGISGYQVVAQRVERHGRSREIRNAHVLARCGVLEVEDLRFLLDKPPCIALALLGIILKETAAYASCDKDPSRNRKRKTGMGDLTRIREIKSGKSRDEAKKCKDCRETGVVARKGEVRRIRVHRTLDLKGVTRIGIDELYVFGNGRKSRKYITVARDLDSGRVLNVSRGKGDAAGLFADWIREAQATKVDDLVAMASTIEEHLTGILGFWEFRSASNASVEGFNNKIRWLVRQAYGYRDFKYFKLKIFDLPNLKSRDGDCCPRSR